MKVLVVDHNAIEPLNQKLYRLISESGDMTLRVIIPTVWHDGYALRKGVATRVSGRFDIITVPVLFPTRTHRLIYRGIVRWLDEFSPDILYVNAEPENFQTYECLQFVLKRSGTRLVFSTWRNIDYALGKFPYKFSFLHRAIEKRVLAAAAHGIAFNDSAPGIFKRLGFEHMAVIPPEIDTGVFFPVERTGDRPFTIGYVGRLDPQKGVDLLIAAVAGLPDEVVLRIIGSGNSEDSLRALAKEVGIGARTAWIPAGRRSAMPAEYSRLDALVLPSRTGTYWKEQFGRVLVEAMACGVPVVGSDSGEIPGVIGDAGLIFREGDVKGLRGELARLSNDSQLRKALAGKGLARVSERYEISRVVPMYRNLLMALTNKPGT
jgi:glycosyltransferase involved in cell wall biosynthesis